MLAAVKWTRLLLGKEPLVPIACFEMDKSSSLEMAGASAFVWAYIVVDMEPAEQDMKIARLEEDMLVTFSSECTPLAADGCTLSVDATWFDSVCRLLKTAELQLFK
jgi:hypothetical protein